MYTILMFSFVICSASEEITLDKSLEYALSHSQKVLSAKEKVKASEGSLTAASAALLPSLSAMGMYTRSSYLTQYSYGGSIAQIPVLDLNGIPNGSYIPFSMPTVSADRQGDIFLGKLSLSYTLFSWGRQQAGYEIALANKQINEEDLKKVTDEVSFDVKKDYYTILLTNELVKVLQETKKSLSAHVKVVEDRFNQGLASKFELLRTKVQLTNIEPQLTRAMTNNELSVMSFNTNLGCETNDKYIASGKLVYEQEIFNLQKCLEDALKKRYEIKQMDLREKMANEAITMAVSGYRPTVIVNANYQANRGQQMPPEDTTWLTGWDAGVIINVPLFDGFAATGRCDEATGNLNQAKLGKEQLIKGINLEVKSSYLTLKAAEDSILAQKENVEVAGESLKMVKERYNQGLSTNLDVLDTEVTMLQAEINYLQSLYDYNVAKERLKKSIGPQGGENVLK